MNTERVLNEFEMDGKVHQLRTEIRRNVNGLQMSNKPIINRNRIEQAFLFNVLEMSFLAHTVYVMSLKVDIWYATKKLPFPFNNVSLSVHDLFEVPMYFPSVLICFRAAQCTLACSIIIYLFTCVPSDSLVVVLYRSWLQNCIVLNFSITQG